MNIKRWELALAAALLVTLSLGTWLENTAETLSSKMIRLHVLAQSDSEEDQTLKLAVRDAVLTEVKARLDGVTSREEAQAILQAEISSIRAAAEIPLTESGYPVRVTLSEETYPTRRYPSFSLPAGRYLSLRVIIGEGKGHNWWCVVYPPLCEQESLSEEDAEDMGLTEEEFTLITGKDNGTLVRFRALELWEKWKAFWAVR